MLKNSKSSKNVIFNETDESPTNVTLRDVLIGNEDDIGDIQKVFESNVRRYYEKNKKKLEPDYVQTQIDKLTDLINSPISDENIKAYNKIRNDVRPNKKVASIQWLTPRGSKSWKEYLDGYGIRFDQPIGSIDGRLKYNDFRKTFRLNPSEDPIDNYIRDTFKDSTTFRKLDDNSKRRILTNILQDDVIPKSQDARFKEFKDMIFRDVKQPIKPKVYNTELINKRTKNLLDHWKVQERMTEIPNIPKSVMEYMKNSPKVKQLINNAIDSIPLEKVGEIGDTVLKQLPVLGNVYGLIPQSVKEDVGRRVLQYARDKIKFII